MAKDAQPKPAVDVQQGDVLAIDVRRGRTRLRGRVLSVMLKGSRTVAMVLLEPDVYRAHDAQKG